MGICSLFLRILNKSSMTQIICPPVDAGLQHKAIRRCWKWNLKQGVVNWRALLTTNANFMCPEIVSAALPPPSAGTYFTSPWLVSQAHTVPLCARVCTSQCMCERERGLLSFWVFVYGCMLVVWSVRELTSLGDEVLTAELSNPKWKFSTTAEKPEKRTKQLSPKPRRKLSEVQKQN